MMGGCQGLGTKNGSKSKVKKIFDKIIWWYCVDHNDMLLMYTYNNNMLHTGYVF